MPPQRPMARREICSRGSSRRLLRSARRICSRPRTSTALSRSLAGPLSAESPIRVVAVGDVMVDVLCAQLPPAGSRVHADVSIRAGGSAVNAAVAAAAAGAAATVVGRVGSDPSADLVEAALAKRSVAAQLARDPD